MADDAAYEGRHQVASMLIAEAYEVPTSTGTPAEKHGLHCGLTPKVNVSMRTSLVQCAYCCEALDPLDVLRQYARKERFFAFQLEAMRKENDELMKAITDKKRELANLRAAIRRVK